MTYHMHKYPSYPDPGSPWTVTTTTGNPTVYSNPGFVTTTGTTWNSTNFTLPPDPSEYRLATVEPFPWRQVLDAAKIPYTIKADGVTWTAFSGLASLYQELIDLFGAVPTANQAVFDTIYRALRAFVLEEHGLVEQYAIHLKALATEAAMDAETAAENPSVTASSLPFVGYTALTP